MLLECLPQADTLGVAAPTHKHHVQMLPDVVSPVSALSLVTPQYGQKATCLRFPLIVRDILLRHALR